MRSHSPFILQFLHPSANSPSSKTRPQFRHATMDASANFGLFIEFSISGSSGSPMVLPFGVRAVFAWTSNIQRMSFMLSLYSEEPDKTSEKKGNAALPGYIKV